MTDRIENDHATWPWPAKLAFAVFVAIAAYFLIAEHRAHVVAFLPWLLLAACPLMHLFMHHGHWSHGGHGESGSDVTKDVAAGSRRGSAFPDVQPAGKGPDAGHQGLHGGRP